MTQLGPFMMKVYFGLLIMNCTNRATQYTESVTVDKDAIYHYTSSAWKYYM